MHLFQVSANQLLFILGRRRRSSFRLNPMLSLEFEAGFIRARHLRPFLILGVRLNSTLLGSFLLEIRENLAVDLFG